MTKFDFEVQQKDFAALRSFWHVVNGLYLWEYFTTLYFELDVIRARGRRAYRRTIWIYSFARAAILISVILSLVDLNTTTPLNCQVLNTLETITAYLGLSAASLLVIFRILAIWDRNKFVVAISAIVWVSSLVVVIQAVARLRSAWVPLVQTCYVLNTEEMKPAIIVTLITDVFLLSTVLVGLLRLRTESGFSIGFGRLGRILWNQGIIWLMIATVAGILPGVFISLNLDVPFNLMFQFPSVTTMVLAATRTYRSLSEFADGSTEITFDNVSKGNNKVSKIVWNNPTQVTLDRSAITADSSTSHVQYPMSQTSVSVSAQQSDKPQELSVNGDLESAIENRVPT